MATYSAVTLQVEVPSRLGTGAWLPSFGSCDKNRHAGVMAAKAITATRWLKEPPT